MSEIVDPRGENFNPQPGDVWCDTALRSDIHDDGVHWHVRADERGEIELFEPNGPGLIPAADVKRIKGGMKLISRTSRGSGR